MTKKIYISFLFILAVINAFSQEYRAGIEYDYKLFNDFKIDSKFEIRSQHTAQKIYNSMFQTGLSYEIFEDFEVGGSMRYTFGNNDHLDDEYSGDYSSRWRFTGDLKYSGKRFDNDIRIDQRLRFQHMIENGDDESEYLRYKIGIDYKLSKNVSPYIALEPYYSFEKDKLKTLRFYTGCEFEVFNNEFEVFMINEILNKKTQIKTNCIVGIAYKF